MNLAQEMLIARMDQSLPWGGKDGERNQTEIDRDDPGADEAMTRHRDSTVILLNERDRKRLFLRLHSLDQTKKPDSLGGRFAQTQMGRIDLQANLFTWGELEPISYLEKCAASADIYDVGLDRW